MKIFQILIAVSVIASSTSCAPWNPVAHKDLEAPKATEQVCYEPDTHLSQKFPDELMHILKIDSVRTDSVCIVFTNDELSISYLDLQTNENRTQTFKGKMRGRDFQVFFKRKHTGIPPFFFISEVDRYRFSIGPDKSLVITEMHDHTAMILMLGGGSGYRNQNVFTRF